MGTDPMHVPNPMHAPMAPSVDGVQQRLLTYFEPDAFTTTERLDDPDSGSTPLFVIVHTKLAPAEALAALERFDQEWWLDQASVTAGRLEVSIAYEA